MIAVYILSALYGLVVGSFLNVVIYRLPLGMSLAKPSSHCPNCGYKLRFYDNIPVISYILLGGKCRKCKKHISFRYTAVELLNCLLWLLVAFVFFKESVLYSIAAMLFISLLICIAFIDLETMYIHDLLTVLLAIPTLMVLFSKKSEGILAHFFGACIGGGSFLLLYLIFKYLLKKEGMGTGDILLMTFLGAFLGWKGILVAILFASVLGCIVLVPLQFINKNENKEFPFAPFLTLGAVLSLFLSDPIITWYASLLSF